MINHPEFIVSKVLQPNGEDLLQRIESWRRGHLDEAAHEAKDFVESRCTVQEDRSWQDGSRGP